ALAVSTGYNIVYKGGAKEITLKLDNISPATLLDYVTRLADMKYVRKGTTVIVASRSDIDSSFYEEEVITHIKLRYMTGEGVAQEISTLMDGSFEFLHHESASRDLWIKGLPAELAKARQVIEMLDNSDMISGGSDALPDHLKFIQLSYLTGMEFSALLESLGYRPGIVMQADSMNLLYVGNDDDFAVVARIQEIVDAKQSSTTVKRVVDSAQDEDGYTRLQIRRDLICEMTGISPSRFYISSNISKSSSGSYNYIMYLRGTPEEVAEVMDVVSQIGG
ncbi:MAG: hypothetical protein LBQ16_05585, partial [Gracilibacteraceae bacterium]|nr:hypothetical protein [Gracilibacteraceae bacterium]